MHKLSLMTKHINEAGSPERQWPAEVRSHVRPLTPNRALFGHSGAKRVKERRALRIFAERSALASFSQIWRISFSFRSTVRSALFHRAAWDISWLVWPSILRIANSLNSAQGSVCKRRWTPATSAATREKGSNWRAKRISSPPRSLDCLRPFPTPAPLRSTLAADQVHHFVQRADSHPASSIDQSRSVILTNRPVFHPATKAPKGAKSHVFYVGRPAAPGLATSCGQNKPADCSSSPTTAEPPARCRCGVVVYR